MSPKKEMLKRQPTASCSLQVAFQDFLLSRKAMRVASRTLDYYNFHGGKFITWLEEQSVQCPEDIYVRHIREFLAELTNKNLASSYVHCHARVIRTLIRFWHEEKYMK